MQCYTCWRVDNTCSVCTEFHCIFLKICETEKSLFVNETEKSLFVNETEE